MSPQMRRSVTFSVLLHAAVLIALLVSFPEQPLPQAGEGISYQVEFESTLKAPVKGPTAKKSPTPSPAPPQPTPPAPKPIAENTAPPPPPPPAPAPTQAVQAPPTAKALPNPPTPAPAPSPAVVKTEQPKPTKAEAVATSIPTPPLPVAAPPTPSKTAQPNKTKNAALDSEELENTLEKLRATTKSNQPPKAVANPESGGAVQDTGNPKADDTAALTADERGAIGDEVRPCWTRDAGALNADKLEVMLTVTTDAQGVVRVAKIADADLDRVNADPVLRAFSDRAVNAVLDARCATLPLPSSMLGSVHSFTFRFSP